MIIIDANYLVGLVISLLVFLMGLTVHEFFHGFTAYKLGDNTPLEQGRLTLNPIPHLDPIGFILVIFAHFGWAKPVQINPNNFARPKLGEVLVSLAGPFSNLVLAVLFGVLLKVSELMPEIANKLLLTFLNYGIQVNLMLAVFNMLPVPPLDGSHLLMVLIPDRFYEFKRKILQFGAIGLMLLLIADSQLKLKLLPIDLAIEFLHKTLLGWLGIQYY